mmetsp:Transcript_23437/g.26708  ORF Transcript_23437/g.26708 Transcript_23437/m.26708 type:complete len:142 (+) Transcript_23437:144-569(+)
MKQTISILPCNRIVTLLGIILSTILILATTCSSFSIIVIEQQIKKYPNLYRQRQRQRQQQEYIFHPFSFKIQNTYHGKAIITSMMKADDNDKKDIDIANEMISLHKERSTLILDDDDDDDDNGIVEIRDNLLKTIMRQYHP